MIPLKILRGKKVKELWGKLRGTLKKLRGTLKKLRKLRGKLRKLWGKLRVTLKNERGVPLT